MKSSMQEAKELMGMGLGHGKPDEMLIPTPVFLKRL